MRYNILKPSLFWEYTTTNIEDVVVAFNQALFVVESQKIEGIYKLMYRQGMVIHLAYYAIPEVSPLFNIGLLRQQIKAMNLLGHPHKSSPVLTHSSWTKHAFNLDREASLYLSQFLADA